jgi:hypothetical protein
MSWLRMRCSFVVFAVALAAASVVGQQAKPPAQPGSGATGAHHIPCARQIGISPAALPQRRAIVEAARAKVAELCKNDSLTPQQRHEQMRQIHQQARQQADAVIPSAQLAALKECQEKQSASSGEKHAAPGTSTGPCGESVDSEESPASQAN